LVPPSSEFRIDLYEGTAPYYDRYRPPYPTALFDDLRLRAAASRRGSLLDLACGTGQIALPLAQHFLQVWAVDQEPGSVAFGRNKAERLGITNITWMAGSAETVTLNGPFDLIAIGNAFQRLNRSAVAERVRSWLVPGGSLALIWGNSPWWGDRPWQKAMEEVFLEWAAKTGASDRVPAGWEAAMANDPHEQVLRRGGFDYAGKFAWTVEQTWTVESLAGFLYSTSFLNRNVLGDRSSEFEKEFAERMLPYAIDGKFYESASYAYELARRPEGESINTKSR
jgi:SAM-dependent methyltransferase